MTARLDGRQWRMASSILNLVRLGPGMTEGQLAERLHVAEDAVHPVVMMLAGRNLLQYAGGYWVPGTSEPGRVS